MEEVGVGYPLSTLLLGLRTTKIQEGFFPGLSVSQSRHIHLNPLSP